MFVHDFVAVDRPALDVVDAFTRLHEGSMFGKIALTMA